MADYPFFVYTSKSEKVITKEIVNSNKKQPLSIAAPALVGKRMDLFIIDGYFDSDISIWANENSVLIGSLNLFMICVAYMVLLDVIHNNHSDQIMEPLQNDNDIEQIKSKLIIKELNKEKYDRYKEKILGNADKNSFTLFEKQIIIYIKKIIKMTNNED